MYFLSQINSICTRIEYCEQEFNILNEIADNNIENCKNFDIFDSKIPFFQIFSNKQKVANYLKRAILNNTQNNRRISDFNDLENTLLTISHNMNYRNILMYPQKTILSH